MKTSTKLLIALFISIPLTLFAYNHLLNKQYEAGKFVQKIRSLESQRVTTDLPPFKHVVVNGAIVEIDSSSGRNYKENIKTVTKVTWYPNIYIASSEINRSGNVNVLKSYEDLVAFQVKADTLYISFQTTTPKRFQSIPSSGESMVRINGGNLKSIWCSNANFTITGKHFSDSVKITASGIYSNFSFSKMHLRHLNLSVSDSSKATIESSSKIEELSYSLLNKGHLSIQSPSASVKKLNADKIDPATVITLSGNSSEMEKFLTSSVN